MNKSECAGNLVQNKTLLEMGCEECKRLRVTGSVLIRWLRRGGQGEDGVNRGK